MNKYTAIIDSPIGKLGIITAENQVQEISFLSSSSCIAPKDDFTKKVVTQLNAYFDDANYQFNLPLDIEQARPFQKTVWCALKKIPSGTTKAYSDLANQLKSGPRAIGNACRHNPIPIIIPCHRVIAKDGGLRGFGGKTSGEKIHIKRWLLDHEGTLSFFKRANNE